MKKGFALLCFVFLLASCQSGKLITNVYIGKDSTVVSTRKGEKMFRQGVSRIKRYDIYSPDVPDKFNGFRIAFISDLHYKSLFRDKELDGLVKTLNALDADILLMGGDYQEGCEYVPELVSRLAEVKTRFGAYGVMGNNDYERCHDEIIAEMRKCGIRILEQKVDTLSIGRERIILAGIKNPFDLKHNGVSPTLGLQPKDFVILLTHTPDYAEDVDVSNTDLVLAGHTHGGQVTFFGLYAPQTGSRYGRRFLSGLKKNSKGIPMIITNGLGTSRKNIRLFAPSEVVLVVLHESEQVSF